MALIKVTTQLQQRMVSSFGRSRGNVDAEKLNETHTEKVLVRKVYFLVFLLFKSEKVLISKPGESYQSSL